MAPSKLLTVLVVANEIRGLWQVAYLGRPMANAARAGDVSGLLPHLITLTIAGAAVWLACRLLRRTTNA